MRSGFKDMRADFKSQETGAVIFLKDQLLCLQNGYSDVHIVLSRIVYKVLLLFLCFG